MDMCKSCEAVDHGAAGTRLPRFLLPSRLVTDAELAKMRPDMLRIIGLPSAPTEAEIAEAVANKGQYRIQIVEVGYCSDTRWREKMRQKLEQHTRLMALLTEAVGRLTKRPT